MDGLKYLAFLKYNVDKAWRGRHFKNIMLIKLGEVRIVVTNCMSVFAFCFGDQRRYNS
jgi:hypothetical protein